MNKNLKVALILPLALMTAALITTASAAPKLSAQSIIVNPVQTSLNVKVWTDRDNSGSQTPNYYVGDKIRIYTSVNQDAYVYLFNVDPNGQVDLILPNRYAGGANYVRANTPKVFPSSQDRFTFDIAAPYGLNKVLALASKTQLNLNDIATFQTQSGQTQGNQSQQGGFADVKVRGQQQLAQALSIVVNPVPQNSWISDVAFYNVAQGYGSGSVQPAPVAQPQPAYSFPVYVVDQQPEWRTTFSSERNADDVYSFYAAELQRQGYRQTDRRADRGRYAGQFRNGGNTSELRITANGGRFEIVIIKRQYKSDDD